jgi:RNA polymerase sigma factor (sigma-70 family)
VARYAERFDFPINESGPEDAIIETEETEKIFKLIEKCLPHSEARAITLRYMNDFSIKDVAEKMNVDGRTVSRYISVGLKKARQFLTIKQGD